MPLPSSGPISAADLNEELGNSPGFPIDFESAAESLLENASRPHSMNEFYGASLGEDFLFSDWTGIVSISEFGVITATVGNATSRTINTSNFLAVTSATPRSVNVTITTPSEFNGEPVTNAGESKTGNKSVTQPAVGRYLSISADDTSLAGDDTSVSLTVTDTYYNNASQTPWEITTETISANSLPVVSFLPITGTGTETVNVTVADNPNGSTRNIRFRVTGTVGGKSSIVDVSQASYTPVLAPTISINDVTPPGPYSYEGQANIGISISRSGGTSFNASIAPSIEYDANAVFSEIQPSGITYYGPTFISGTGTSFKVEIPSRSDGTVNTYSSSLSVNVSSEGGNASDTRSLEQVGLVVWNTSPPTSLSFESAQESLSITLNTNLSWTAQISGTGFSIAVGSTSGNGTATFSILATTNDGGLRTGILSFSSPGQTTIQVTLTQDAYVAPTPVSWTRTPTTLTWPNGGVFYQDVDVLFQNRTSTITWKAVLDSNQHFEISLSSSSGYGKQILGITNDDLIYVRPKNPNSTSFSYDSVIRLNPVTSGTGLSELTVSLSQSPSDLGCLLQGTKITMEDGSTKLIQNLEIGDSLKSLNIVGMGSGELESLQFQTDNLEYTSAAAVVTNITKLERKTLISFNEGLLQSSVDHNHFIRRDGICKFLPSNEVFVGDYLMNEFGEFIEITLVEEYSDINYIVYKIDVEEHDVFFANGLLTHNAKIEF